MKETKLKMLDYLRMLQYLGDEGFNVEPMDNYKNFTVGCYVKEMDERYYFPSSEFEERCRDRQKIDVAPYHGRVKSFVEGLNKLVDQFIDLDIKKTPNEKQN